MGCSIEMDLSETELEGVDLIHLAHNRDWWQALLNMLKRSGSIKGREFLDYLSVLLTFQ
jgi:hypothetical protein